MPPLLTAPAVYPLRPGRPRVWRLTAGRWAWECHCGPLARPAAPNTSRGLRATHAEALRDATRHAHRGHDPLEAAYALRAAPPPERCVCCGRDQVTYWNHLAQPFCPRCADGACTHRTAP